MKKSFLLCLSVLIATAPTVQAGMGLIHHYNRNWAGPLGMVAGSSCATAGVSLLARAAAQVRYPDDLLSSPKAGAGFAAILGGTAFLLYSWNRWTRETAIDAYKKAKTTTNALNNAYGAPISFMNTPSNSDLAHIYQGILSHNHANLDIQYTELAGKIQQANQEKEHLEKFASEIESYGPVDQGNFTATKKEIVGIAHNLPYLRNWSLRVQQLNNAASWYSLNKNVIENALQWYATVKSIADISKITSQDAQATYAQCAVALQQLWPDDSAARTMFGIIENHLKTLQEPSNVVLENIRKTTIANLQDKQTKLSELWAFKNDFLSWQNAGYKYEAIKATYKSVLSLESPQSTLIADILIANVGTDYRYPLVSLLEGLEENMGILDINVTTLSQIAMRQINVPILSQEAHIMLDNTQKLKKQLGQLKALLLKHPNTSDQVQEKRKHDFNAQLQQFNTQVSEVKNAQVTLASNHTQLADKVTTLRTDHNTLSSTVSTNYQNLDRRVADLDRSLSTTNQNVSGLVRRTTTLETNQNTMWATVFPSTRR